MTPGDYLRAIAAAGDVGLSRDELSELSVHWGAYLRAGLRGKLVEQTGTGQARKYRLRDPSLVDAIAPDTAGNVLQAEEVAEGADYGDDGGPCFCSDDWPTGEPDLQG